MTRRIQNPDTDADRAVYQALAEKCCFVMTAGAGSGKTTSLVKAMHHVAKEERQALAQSGRKVACITYTEIARNELIRDLGEDLLCHVSTIHSFLWQLIKPFQADIRDWVGRRNTERLAELQERQAGFGARVQARAREAVRVEIEECEQLVELIPRVRRFSYFAGRDYRNGIVSHDDVIRMVPQLLQERPLLRLLLAQKYPYFFFDESQDTDDGVVDSFKAIAGDPALAAHGFCLGFFGDPMQKIYTMGRGKIEPMNGWTVVTKAENFRCSSQVLRTINRIRRDGDDVEQVAGLRRANNTDIPTPDGYACAVVLPVNANRGQSIVQVRRFLAQQRNDALWMSDSVDADVRVLVIEHAMAAKRLGFDGLFQAFRGTDESIQEAFRTGGHWALTPFHDFLLPLVEAARDGQDYMVMDLLRQYSPVLKPETFRRAPNPVQILANLKTAVEGLLPLLDTHRATSIQDVLAYAQEYRLLMLDGRLRRMLAIPDPVGDDGQPMGLAALAGPGEAPLRLTPEDVLLTFLRLPVSELWGYRNYIENRSVYATQQGIKGAEFARVVVIVDDTESNHFLFNYEKLLGLEPLSERDAANRAEGKDTPIERTRRLFYVCCSRALRDLAVVCYVEEPDRLRVLLQDAALFPDNQIFGVADLP